SFFSRDLVDYNRRKERGFEIRGLEGAIGRSLQQQLLETKVQSQNQLLRLLGLKSASPIQPCAQRRLQSHHKHSAAHVAAQDRAAVVRWVSPSPTAPAVHNGAESLFDHLRDFLDQTQNALEQTDFRSLSRGERQEIVRRLTFLLPVSTRALSMLRS